MNAAAATIATARRIRSVRWRRFSFPAAARARASSRVGFMTRSIGGEPWNSLSNSRELTLTFVYGTVTSMSVDTTGCCLPTRVTRVEHARASGVAAAAKTLADPIRVEIIDLLRAAGGPVCQ